MYTLQAKKKGIPPQAIYVARCEPAIATATATAIEDSWHSEEKESEEEPEEAQQYLTREYFIGLPPSARVMKSQRSCKYND
ncbi:hypothetical protein DPMN_094601 [Dreissena polymorpha]|uniref:Uncharacterized protein n=1 Tax=Dreissena polymorpha TaxID=45954 RepID=A0A9D4R235_DREPO|nr:hypothetical protein DPMN_094601 [Dreissena polymorpha]